MYYKENYSFAGKSSLLLGLLSLSVVSIAADIDVSGNLGVETRYFWQDASTSEQPDGATSSMFIQPEVRWKSEDRRSKVNFVGFARADQHDAERTHADIRELYYTYDARSWDITVGINKVFWGVAESRHLTDVINQSDQVEDIDQEDKLGQPMVNVNAQFDWGRLSLYALPYFHTRTFAGKEGRLNGPFRVWADDDSYESSADEYHTDIALRYSHYIDDIDIGVHVFEGTNREPILLPQSGGQSFSPFYEQITQVGVEAQLTRGEWLWKFESIYRESERDEFYALVAGLEYSFFQIQDSDADLGLLAEYLRDERDQTVTSTPYNNDLFLGTRLAMNDTQDSSVLAGFVTDLDNQSVFYNLEAETRLGSSVNLEARVRVFSNIDARDGLVLLKNEDYAQLRASWYF